MKEIIEINQRILAEAPDAVPKDFGCIMVTRRDDAAKELAALPAKIRADLVKFLKKLNQAMPNDFGYLINLGDDDPSLMLMYSDGPQAEGNCPVEWDVKRSIFDQLPKIDWDMHRKRVMGMGHYFDDLRGVSKDIPPAIVPTDDIQKEERDAVEAFVKSKRKKPQKIHMLTYRGFEGYEEVGFDSMKAFRYDLLNAMTTGYEIIAVLVDGKLLPAKKLDGYQLSTKQEIQRTTALTGKPHIQRTQIQTFLKNLEYPLQFLDFETFSTAIPMFDGTSPYEQIPFQFSLHIGSKAGAKPEHRKFLAEGRSDPRAEFMRQLKSAVSRRGRFLFSTRRLKKAG